MILELDLFLAGCGWCHQKFGGEDRFCSFHWSKSHIRNLTWSSFSEPLSPTHSLASLVSFMFFEHIRSLLPWDFCTCLFFPSALPGISSISIWLTFLTSVWVNSVTSEDLLSPLLKITPHPLPTYFIYHLFIFSVRIYKGRVFPPLLFLAPILAVAPGIALGT